MHQQLYQLLDRQKCFYNFRFGFRFNISTINALISITENIQPSLDLRKYTEGVFTGVRKAFHTADQDVLLRKPEH